MIKNSFLLTLVLICFTGCISITKELPSYKTYFLELDKPKINTITLNKSIEIYEPKALASINSIAISYKKDGFFSESYVLSKWSDKPSKMIQQSIASYLTRSESFDFVTTSKLRIDTDYKLYSELIDFNQSFENGKSLAKFSIRVYLVNNKNEKVSFKNFSYEKETSSKNAQGLVNTINLLYKNFLKDLNQFLQNSLKS